MANGNSSPQRTDASEPPVDSRSGVASTSGTTTPAVSKSTDVLNRVWWRLWLARVASRTFRIALILATVYGIILLVTRLAGLSPELLTGSSLLIPPALALIAGLLWPGRPSLQDAARSIDRTYGTRDLFLTRTLLSTTAGAYQPLVERDAETLAAKIKASEAVPFLWQSQITTLATAMSLLVIGQFFLPTLDPFGAVAEAEITQTREKILAEQAKATEIRKAELQDKELDEALSPDVANSLTNLQRSLQAMKKEQKKKNSEALNASQKVLGEKFRATNAALKSLMKNAQLNQNFGGQGAAEQKKWSDELRNGSSDQVSKEVESLKEEIESLMKTEDPLERTEKERAIERRLKNLNNLAQNQIGSDTLKAAVDRANEQLSAAMSDGNLSDAEKTAIQESLALAGLELKQVAQSSRDLKALEKSLQAIAQARQLNQKGELDGSKADSLTAMEQYQELYEEQLAAMGGNASEGDGEGDGDGQGEGEGEGEGDGDGEGEGEGSNGKGRGKREKGSGKVAEADPAGTGFVNEKSETPIQKGKLLMSMKNRGLGDEPDENLKLEYKAALESIKEGYSQAIESEQIPPGYRGGIQSYFDSLGKSQPVTPAP